MRNANDKFLSFAAHVELKKVINQSNELKIIDPYIDAIQMQVAHKGKKHILFYAFTRQLHMEVKAAVLTALSSVASKLSLSLMEMG
jgi:hypothetical protein